VCTLKGPGEFYSARGESQVVPWEGPQVIEWLGKISREQTERSKAVKLKNVCLDSVILSG
jgi:hypothetical protein